MAVASRNLSFTSYLSPEAIKLVIGSHKTSVRYWALIQHDRDDSEIIHCHFVLVMYCPWKPKQVCRWFEAVDDTGKPVNTFGECVSDMDAILDYMTHSDRASREAGKFLYSPSDICGFGLEYMRDRRASADNTFDILLSLKGGASLLMLTRVYGKDFVYHYSQFAYLLEDMKAQQVQSTIIHKQTQQISEQLSINQDIGEYFK